MKHAQLKKDLLVVGVCALFIVAALLLVRKNDNGHGSPVQRQHPLANRESTPRASHEIQLPHGTNTMLVNGQPSSVAESSERGVSMLDSLDAVENPLLASVFSDVIRDQKRDFFGPWQFFGPEEQATHFAFLRYHRLGNDNDGAFTVQAGEARAEEIFWEPPHLFDGFPFCSLLSWKPGEELLYRCLGNTREWQKDTSEREWKYEYHFAIPKEETTEYVFSRTCRGVVHDEGCSAYNEELVDPLAWSCITLLRGLDSPNEGSSPLQKEFYKNVVKKSPSTFIHACVSHDDRRHDGVVFLRESAATQGKEPIIEVGEYDAKTKRIRILSKRHPKINNELFCEIDEWIPGVLVRYSCTNPTIAMTADLIPVTEYQWDIGLDYHTARTCRGARLFVGDTTPQCTPRKPL